MTDFEFIRALQKGDQAAFRDLVEAHQKIVYNTALGFLKHEAEAEDIAQEVFVEAWISIAKFKGESRISTWLYRITVNKCLDHHRKQNRDKRRGIHQSIEGDGALNVPDFKHPGILLEDQELAATLFGAIEQLPENQKVAFTLHKVSELSHQEIGEVMEITQSAIESLIHRAKQNLRKILENYYRNL